MSYVHTCTCVSGAHNPKGRSIKLVIPPVVEWHLHIYGGYAWLVYYTTMSLLALTILGVLCKCYFTTGGINAPSLWVLRGPACMHGMLIHVGLGLVSMNVVDHGVDHVNARGEADLGTEIDVGAVLGTGKIGGGGACVHIFNVARDR